MKNISSIASRGQSPLRSFSTVNKYTRQPMALQVRRNSWPFSNELTHKIASVRWSGTLNLRHSYQTVIEPRSILPPLARRIQEPQKRRHSLTPRQFIVLGAFHPFIVQIAFILLSTMQQHVAVAF